MFFLSVNRCQLPANNYYSPNIFFVTLKKTRVKFSSWIVTIKIKTFPLVVWCVHQISHAKMMKLLWQHVDTCITENVSSSGFNQIKSMSYNLYNVYCSFFLHILICNWPLYFHQIESEKSRFLSRLSYSNRWCMWREAGLSSLYFTGCSGYYGNEKSQTGKARTRSHIVQKPSRNEKTQNAVEHGKANKWPFDGEKWGNRKEAGIGNQQILFTVWIWAHERKEDHVIETAKHGTGLLLNFCLLLLVQVSHSLSNNELFQLIENDSRSSIKQCK